MTASRILLVEDFEPFRRFVRMALEPRAGLKVVGEAEDGIDAVRQAQELQPDLILLDIGFAEAERNSRRIADLYSSARCKTSLHQPGVF